MPHHPEISNFLQSFDHAAERTCHFLRNASAFVNICLVCLHQQGLPMPVMRNMYTKDFVVASVTKKQLNDEQTETTLTLSKRRNQNQIEPMPNLSGYLKSLNAQTERIRVASRIYLRLQLSRKCV